jgi:hypothetical protein
MELTTVGRWGVEDGRTPDGDVWFVAQDSGEITGLRVRGPARRRHDAGSITVALPEGGRAELRGAERVFSAWRVPTRRAFSRRPLRSPRS